jgi:hypothetical protein
MTRPILYGLIVAAYSLAGTGGPRYSRASGERLGPEDLLLPSSAILLERDARLGGTAARTARTGVPEVRSERGAVGPRTFLRADQAAKGIQYFIVGSSAKVRTGDLRTSALTAKGRDPGYGFMLVGISGDELLFREISAKGETIDAGSLRRAGKTEPNPGRSTQPVEQAPPAQTTRG